MHTTTGTPPTRAGGARYTINVAVRGSSHPAHARLGVVTATHLSSDRSVILRWHLSCDDEPRWRCRASNGQEFEWVDQALEWLLTDPPGLGCDQRELRDLLALVLAAGPAREPRG